MTAFHEAVELGRYSSCGQKIEIENSKREDRRSAASWPACAERSRCDVVILGRLRRIDSWSNWLGLPAVGEGRG
jgi:hypothetical protein